ncbi:MAG TPA: hydroxymethylbilane synthase [Gemmatimonadales bacterium]|jgi:hydroxymethylbilane synthase
MKLRIGTRGSALARAQADDVARRLAAAGHLVGVVVISTLGDRAATQPFADVGAFGIFVREIEAALIGGEIDIAVHSYKDLPSSSPAGLVVASVPERLDSADLLLIRNEALDPGAADIPLRQGARVGTSAARRTAWLQAARPDLVAAALRGNVPTRIAALVDGRYDAIVLAAAGVVRLQRLPDEERLTIPPTITVTRLDPERFVPAPSQGAIALQVHRDRAAVVAAVAAINDLSTARALKAERTALRLADGGCSLPFGAWCNVDSTGELRLVSALGLDDGTVARAEARGDDPDGLAASVWEMLAPAAATSEAARITVTDEAATAAPGPVNQ